MKVTQQQVFEDYFKFFKKEALLKAFLCALAIGLGAIFITAFSCWFTEFNGFWLYPITFAVSFGAVMPLFYFYVFYPTKKYVAKRLDQVGLEERILTMVEFENQDAYIMQRQREDAMNALKKLNAQFAKISLSAFLIAAPVVAAATGSVMIGVDAASKAGLVQSGYELIGNMNKDKTTYELVYKIPDSQKGCGVLYSASNPNGSDEITMTVGKGQDGEKIMPVASKGYVFLRWSDGVGDYVRNDTSVQGKIVVTAIFEEIGLDYGDDEAFDWQDPFAYGDEDGDETSSSGRPKPGNNENRNPYKPQDKDKVGGGVDTNQFVFDGATDYSGIAYEQAYADAMEALSQSGADDESKQIANDYMEAIKRG